MPSIPDPPTPRDGETRDDVALVHALAEGLVTPSPALPWADPKANIRADLAKVAELGKLATYRADECACLFRRGVLSTPCTYPSCKPIGR